MKTIKKKRKGFTLVELLVAISILAIMTVIAIPTLRAFQTNNTKTQYENYKKSIAVSAKLYNDSYTDDLFGNAPYGCQKVKLSELINKKLAKDIQLKDVTCNVYNNNSLAIIKKFNNEYSYDTFAYCENSAGVVQYSDMEKIVQDCELSDGMPTITATSHNETSDNSKKKSVVIHLNDDYGFTANQKIAYLWSRELNINNIDADDFKDEYEYNNSYIKTTGEKVVLNSKSITMSGSSTGTYALYVKPIKVQNIVNNSLTNIQKIGEYRFDHQPPDCPVITATKKGGGALSKETPAQQVQLHLKFATADTDLQNYDYQIKYDDGDWSSTKTNDKNELIIAPSLDGKVKIRVKPRDNANNIRSNWCVSDTYYNDNTAPTKPTVKGYKRTNSTAVTSKGSLTEVNDSTFISGYSFVNATGSTDTFGTISYYYTASGTHGAVSSTKGAYLNVDNEGTSTVRFRACDSAGNCSGEVSYVVKLDRTGPTKPTLTGYSKKNATNVTNGNGLGVYTAGNWLRGWVVVVASGSTDALGNGVNYYNGSTKVSYVNVNSQGSTTVKMKACDNLSNCSAEVSFDVKLDRCEATTISWNSWGACSKSCGTGSQSRTGTKYSSVAGHTTYLCGSAVNAEKSSQNCNTQNCCSSVTYKNGSTCSKACGGGTYNRLAYSAYDGSRCSSKDESSGGSACNSQGCCSSVVYKNGNRCSKSCGGGTHNRLAYSKYDGSRCSSKDESSGGSACNTHSCNKTLKLCRQYYTCINSWAGYDCSRTGYYHDTFTVSPNLVNGYYKIIGGYNDGWYIRAGCLTESGECSYSDCPG